MQDKVSACRSFKNVKRSTIIEVKAQPKEMLPIVDKPTLQFIIEEAVDSGVE